MHLIHITAQYSNAVLLVILPHVSDFCQKLDLGVPTPIDINAVASFSCSSDRDNPGGTVYLTNGCAFAFGDGIVDTFFDLRHSFSFRNNKRRIAELSGPSQMDKGEAVEFARATIRKLGYSEVDLFADADPQFIQTPRVVGTNNLPYYTLSSRKE